MKTLTLKQLFTTAAIVAASTVQAQAPDYLGIFTRQNADLRDTVGPIDPDYVDVAGNNFMYFTDNVAKTTIPHIGKIGVTASYSNGQFDNFTDNTNSPTSSLVFGGTRNTSAKVMRSDDVFVKMGSVETVASFYKPTVAIDDMDPNTHYAFEQFISAEQLENEAKPTEGVYYMGDVTYTFTEPVDNPILHITGLGGAYADGTTRTTQIFSLDYEMVTSATATGIELIDATEFTELDGTRIKSTFTFTDYISSGQSGATNKWAGSGSFLVNGENIESVTFKMFMRGKVAGVIWSTPDSTYPDGQPVAVENFVGERFNSTWTLPLYCIEGSVVVDYDQNGTPAPDPSITGGAPNGPYTEAGVGTDNFTTLYACLIDENGNVAQIDEVDPTTGYFDFCSVIGDQYKVLLTTDSTLVPGDVAPATATLGDGWESTEESFVDTDSTTGTVQADLTPDSVTEFYAVNQDSSIANNRQNLILGIQNADLIVPVELVSFAGQVNGDDVDLTWTTATENNNSHFEIERSTDGKNFVKVAEVAGNGTVSTSSDYNYTDAGVGADATVVYYKLKQVDFDGTFEYSQVIVRVEFDAKAIETSIYPNPVNQGGDVQVEAQEIKTIEVFNVEGKLVESYEPNGAQVFTINTKNFATGIYFVKVNGEESKKLIVK